MDLTRRLRRGRRWKPGLLPRQRDGPVLRDQRAFLDSVDTILLGRKTYELFVDYWPTATTDEEIIADRLNERSSARRWSEAPVVPDP
jgi:hypothetical protein